MIQKANVYGNLEDKVKDPNCILYIIIIWIIELILVIIGGALRNKVCVATYITCFCIISRVRYTYDIPTIYKKYTNDIPVLYHWK